MNFMEENNEEIVVEQKEQEKKFGFNFAAFIMPPIWGLFNGVYVGLIALFPLAAPIVSFYVCPLLKQT